VKNRGFSLAAALVTALLSYSCFASLGCGGGSTPDPSGSSSSGQGGAGGSSSSSGGGGSGTAQVVVNEIAAAGDDWIELFNAGDAVADLAGYAVADEVSPGMPKVGEAVRFEAGTMLDPGAYLLIVADNQAPMPGPQTTCLPNGGPSSCYQAGWAISSGNGDVIYLLSPSDEIISSNPYPGNAAEAGQTWGRLPNGVGEFALSAPTPGAANEPAP
jgi:lamin tail-like protein